MGYIVAKMNMYCGIRGSAELRCESCRKADIWQKISARAYKCIRCNTVLSIANNISGEVNFFENKRERDELIND